MQEKFLQLFKETLDIEDKDIQMTDEFSRNQINFKIL